MPTLRRRHRRPRLRIVLVLAAWLVSACETQAPVPLAPRLRIATSGDYMPFSVMKSNPRSSGVQGFDADVARAYARDRGLEIEWVRFRWPNLLDDLAANRFDVAMSGITVRPERSIAGRFTIPVATSGAVLLYRVSAVDPVHEPQGPRDLDRPEISIAVNAGGHLERVARRTFERASLRAIPDNAEVIQALRSGEVDAVVTDDVEAPRWSAGASDLRVLGPFTRDRKAYLLAADSSARARDLDAWLLEREADGWLPRLRGLYLYGEGRDGNEGGPLPSVLASMSERLALMPDVAEAKRRGDIPVEAPAVEQRVIAAAQKAVAEAWSDVANTSPARREPSADRVAGVFREQIEAAKEIQRARLSNPAPPASNSPSPDLARDLRPALIRIGNRIAWLLVRLPPDVTQDVVLTAARRELSGQGLTDERIESLARALHRLATSMNPAAP